jgi:4'-phosphopantetheinyl transferase
MRIIELIMEIIIKTIIIKELEIENKFIFFDKNEYGKPYLRGYSKFNFNISHSGDFVVCAIDELSVGIDIVFSRLKHAI